MTYANLRGFLDTASKTGADQISPGGLAWMTASGWSFNGELDHCKAAIDKEYDTPLELQMEPANFDLAYIKLYMDENKRTSRLGTLVHPSRIGQYLNALILYATIFGSPLGSTAQPTCWSHCYGDDWQKEPSGIFKSKVPLPILEKLQRLAVQTVDWFKVASLWADMGEPTEPQPPGHSNKPPAKTIPTSSEKDRETIRFLETGVKSAKFRHR